MYSLMILDLIPSLAFGIPGNYYFHGMRVDFVDSGTSVITNLALGIFSGHYLDTFLHELGHNLAFRYVCGRYGKISIHSNGEAFCIFSPSFWDKEPSDPLNTLISLAGPLAGSAFGVLRAVAIRQCLYWVHKRKNGAPLNRVQSIIFTILKIQNYMSVIFPVAELGILLWKYDTPPHLIVRGSDFMQIYHYSGVTGVILSTVLITSISALAIKIMRSDIPVEQPLRSKVYTSIMAAIDRARQATYEVNLIAMGVMKSAIDFVGSPLVVQMNAKRLGAPKNC